MVRCNILPGQFEYLACMLGCEDENSSTDEHEKCNAHFNLQVLWPIWGEGGERACFDISQSHPSRGMRYFINYLATVKVSRDYYEGIPLKNNFPSA